eukprot:10795775-Alexandrium_andersonii.AAC.1
MAESTYERLKAPSAINGTRPQLCRPQTTLEMDHACKLRMCEGCLALASCSASRCKLQRKLQR